MSLIQDALKRQEQEIGRVSAESAERGLVPPKAPPPIPSELPKQAPLPEVEIVPSGKKKSYRGVGVLIASLFVIVLMLGVAGYFFLIAAKTYRTGRNTAPAPAGQQAAGEPAAAAAEPATAVPSPTVPATATPAPRKTAPVSAKPVEAKAPPVVKPTPVRPPARESAVKSVVGREPPSPGPKNKWPKVTVMGVVVKSDPRLSTAVINSSMVGTYEYIDGVRVLEIRSEGVLLQFEGEKRLVQLGSSTQ